MYSKLTTTKYNQLPLSLKANLLFHNGDYITEMELGDRYRLQLYKLPDFYVEVTRDTKQEKITAMLAFDNEQKLEPFLDDIDLTELM